MDTFAASSENAVSSRGEWLVLMATTRSLCVATLNQTAVTVALPSAAAASTPNAADASTIWIRGRCGVPFEPGAARLLTAAARGQQCRDAEPEMIILNPGPGSSDGRRLKDHRQLRATT